MLVLSLLFNAAAALKAGSSLPLEIGPYTIGRLEKSNKAAAELSELSVTNNVLTLERAPSGSSISSTFVQAMRQHGRGGVARLGNTQGSTPLEHALGGNVFFTSVNVGGQDFKVVIDTGSSDPWLAQSSFTCYDPTTREEIPEEACYFGPLYNQTQSSTYTVVPNQSFNISYADGEYLTGDLALERFTMAGIIVPNQQFAVVDQAAWYGDGYTSGLIGFAYRTLTSAYAGNDPTAPKNGQSRPYNPLFVNMYTNENVPPVFSMAVDRDERRGGILALGGVPDIPHAPYYANTPIIPVQVSTPTRDAVYNFYTIDIDGFAYSNETGAQFNPFDNDNPQKIPLVSNDTEVIVDSGTSLVYIPDDNVEELAAMFNPPAEWDPRFGVYFVDCDASVPTFGVGIGQKIFYMNEQDLIVQAEPGMCIMGVQPSLESLSILGGAWLKNVIAVFDIGAEQMRFAARQFYNVTSVPM